tara:strand:- start:533 stop:805 length:273 start_codon:yes stop_codon:yes gene_type:complete
MTETPTPVEKVSQETMLAQFRERFQKVLDENQELAKKIKNNEVIALKLQGAIEALEYYNENPPGTDIVDNVDIPGDDVGDGSPFPPTTEE